VRLSSSDPTALPEAITVDLWYTLIYQTPPEREAYEADRRLAWGRSIGPPALPDRRLDALLRHHARENDRRDRSGQGWSIEGQADWARSHLGRPVSAHVLRAGLGRALGTASVRVAPGALRALDRLQSLRIPVGIVSNIVHEPGSPVRRLLGHCGLAPYVSAVVLSSEIGYAKPSPVPIRRALRLLGTPAARSLHIGDLPADRDAAWSAGAAAATYTGLRRWRSVSGSSPGPSGWDSPRFDRWAGFDGQLPRLYRAARAVRRRHGPRVSG